MTPAAVRGYSRQQVLLVELPPGFDAAGDAGTIGRVVCRRAAADPGSSRSPGAWQQDGGGSSSDDDDDDGTGAGGDSEDDSSDGGGEQQQQQRKRKRKQQTRSPVQAAADAGPVTAACLDLKGKQR